MKEPTNEELTEAFKKLNSKPVIQKIMDDPRMDDRYPDGIPYWEQRHKCSLNIYCLIHLGNKSELPFIEIPILLHIYYCPFCGLDLINLKVIIMQKNIPLDLKELESLDWFKRLPEDKQNQLREKVKSRLKKKKEREKVEYIKKSGKPEDAPNITSETRRIGNGKR